MTSFALSGASPAKTRADAVVVGVHSGKKPRLAAGADDVTTAFGRRLAPLLDTMGVTGKPGEVVRVPGAEWINSPLLVFVGLGSLPSGADARVSADVVRRAAGDAARSIGNSASVALALPADSAELVQAVVEGFLLGGYTFTRYKSFTSTTSQQRHARPAEVAILAPRRAALTEALAEGQRLAEAVMAVRDWVNLPPNDLTPPLFAAQIEEAVAATNKTIGRAKGRARVRVTVHDEKALAEMGAGGILSVGLSSPAPPRMVRLEYGPADAVAHLALVGKGITYDSGGLTIKPPSSMSTMKSDMAGAAAVVRATLLIAALGLPVRVTCVVGLAENMISGTGSRPGDVVTMLSGTTVELTNIDAEGRMVLGDALHLAAQEEPDLLVDVATLTGAMVTALGDQVTGVLGTDDAVARIIATAERAGEPVWPMPIPEAMDERVRSSRIADLSQSDWIRWGAGLYAAAFLKAFVGDRPWAHLDIAGPSYVSTTSGHITTGGTGVGVATLVALAHDLARDLAS